MSLDVSSSIKNSKYDYTTLIFDDNHENNMSNRNSNSKLKKMKLGGTSDHRRSISVKKGDVFYTGQNYYPAYLFNSATVKV
jgi:hypothetical protein